MKVYLRQNGTKLLYISPQEWTAQHEKALTFPSSLAALDCARANGLTDISILLCFDDHRLDLLLPVSDGLNGTPGSTRHPERVGSS